MDDLTSQNDGAALDLASRLTQDHHQSLKLWLRMLSCTVRIENEIRSRLRTTFDITLPRFDLMAQLERYPDGLRMGELSKRMMVTGGNITGITDQLEQEALVVRVPDPEGPAAPTSRQADPRGPYRLRQDGGGARGAGSPTCCKDMSPDDKGPAHRAALANETAPSKRIRNTMRYLPGQAQQLPGNRGALASYQASHFRFEVERRASPR